MIMRKLLPVQRNELPVFACISAMMFCTTFVHALLRILKDALLLSHSSAEMISAIKIWLVWPTSIVFILLYMKASDRMTRSRLYHTFNLFFISFFLVYLLVVYPHCEQWQLHLHSSAWAAGFRFLRYPLMVIDHWTITCFYVTAELWASMMSMMLVWEVVNHITTLEQSARFYSLYGAARSLGVMLSSYCAAYETYRHLQWRETLHESLLLIVVVSLFISLLFMVLCKLVGIQRINQEVSAGSMVKKRQPKVSLSEHIKRVFSSKTILLVTTLLLCYGMSINLLECIWKKSIGLYFHGQGNLVQRFMSSVNFATSLFSVILGLLASCLIRKIGWRLSALVTPSAVLIGIGLLFIGAFSGSYGHIIGAQGGLNGTGAVNALFGIPALQVIVFCGAAAVMMARGAKNSFFDTTKEIVYIPLGAELRSKGKATAEILGMRFGKGSGAIIQQLLLASVAGSDLLSLSPYFCGCLAVVLVVWFYAVFYLNRIYRRMQELGGLAQ